MWQALEVGLILIVAGYVAAICAIRYHHRLRQNLQKQNRSHFQAVLMGSEVEKEVAI